MEVLGPWLLAFSEGKGRRSSLPSWLGILILLTGLTGAERTFGQAVSREYQIKAVLLYNLTQFADWPESAFPTKDAPLTIGLLGPNPFGTALDDAVRGEKSNQRPIVVRRFRNVQEVTHCQVLFVSANEKENLRTIFPHLRNRSVLTVADFEGFVEAGGMIQFFKSPEAKIRLKMDVKAIKAVGIALSGKLMRVASVVSPPKE